MFYFRFDIELEGIIQDMLYLHGHLHFDLYHKYVFKGNGIRVC